MSVCACTHCMRSPELIAFHFAEGSNARAYDDRRTGCASRTWQCWSKSHVELCSSALPAMNLAEMTIDDSGRRQSMHRLSFICQVCDERSCFNTLLARETYSRTPPAQHLDDEAGRQASRLLVFCTRKLKASDHFATGTSEFGGACCAVPWSSPQK